MGCHLIKHILSIKCSVAHLESRSPSSPEDMEHVSEEQHQSPKWTEMRGIPHSLHTEFQTTVISACHWYNSSGLSNCFWLHEIAAFLQKVKYRSYVTLYQVRESLKLQAVVLTLSFIVLRIFPESFHVDGSWAYHKWLEKVESVLPDKVFTDRIAVVCY